MVILGALPAFTVSVWPSVTRASEVNVLNAGLRAPLASSRPLCQGLPVESRETNQMNIWMFGSFFAIVRACFAYADCLAVVTPFGSPGFVSWPYSVIQIGTTR